MSREYYDDYRHGASRKRRKSLPGSVFNGVMLILSVATGAAMIVTLLAPFVHPGRTWIFPVLGLVAPAVYVITLLVTLYWIIRWRWRIALPLVVLLLAGLFKVPLFLKPELRRHYGRWSTARFQPTLPIWKENPAVSESMWSNRFALPYPSKSWKVVVPESSMRALTLLEMRYCPCMP